jgi:hypothetical protein
MKRLSFWLSVPVILFGLIACSGSSDSGATLDMNGTWIIYPSSTNTSVVFNNFRATLQQSGANVIATSVTRSAPPGTVACSSGQLTLSGAASGNKFNGILKTNSYQASFALSGTSSSMSGTFTMTISSGPCAGAGIVTGTATMAKI